MSQGAARKSQEPDWETCASIARRQGRSFFLASRMLRGDRRRSILAAYAYCRLADDIVDRSTGDRAETEQRLLAWEHELEQPVHPVAIAFAHSRERFGIPERPARELFEGMRADLTNSTYETWPELRRYCYLVAGTVGLLVAPILGCSDSHALSRAAELGIAMQLTNILRDVGEDAAMGRIYLPTEELERYGVDPAQLALAAPGPGFTDLMEMQVHRARELYQRALTGVPALSPSGRLTTLVAARLYSGILDQIESNDFDVFRQRAVVPRGRKALQTVVAASGFLWLSLSAAEFPRTSNLPQPAMPVSADPEIEGRLR